MKLKKHQLIPIKFIKNNRGLLLFHSTGSGKTLTSLYAMYQFINDIIIMGPKSSKKTFTDNIKKAQLDESRVTFYTFAKIKIALQTNTEIFQNKNIIVDEAHNLRSDTNDNLDIISALSQVNKIILLSATPVINYLTDLSMLVNIIKDNDDLPINKFVFANMYYDKKNNKIINKDDLKYKLSDCISYYQNINTVDYPTYEVKYMPCIMDDIQLKEYERYVKKFFYSEKEIKGDIHSFWFHEMSGRKKNYFLLYTRQLSNVAIKQNTSPKLEQLIDIVKKGPFPIVIYSNFLSRGVYSVAHVLKKQNISYQMITGEVSSDKIMNIVNNYNAGMFDVLLLSSAGSESLDLKNTRQIHILEPYWNEARITQVIGRAIRYKSHEFLPKRDRHVVIYRWLSVFPKDIVNQSADEYLVNLSEGKYKMADKFGGLIKSVSIENRDTVQYKKYKKAYKKAKGI